MSSSRSDFTKRVSPILPFRSDTATCRPAFTGVDNRGPSVLDLSGLLELAEAFGDRGARSLGAWCAAR